MIVYYTPEVFVLQLEVRRDRKRYLAVEVTARASLTPYVTRHAKEGTRKDA